MKRKFILAISTLCILLATVIPSHAQGKIGTVDMRKVLDKYYKRTAALQALKEKEESLTKDGKVYVDDLNKIKDEYDKLITASYDQSVTPAEREKRKASAEAKQVEFQTQQKALQAFRDTATETLDNMNKRMIDKIIEEIRAAVNAKAKADGYTFVLDVSGNSLSQVPLVLYTNGANDLTDAVIAQLNALAPSAGATTNSTPGTPAAGSK